MSKMTRNERRRAAKRRLALRETDNSNTKALKAKLEIIRHNCETMGKRQANRHVNRGICWLDPSNEPLGFTRRRGIGQLGKIGKAL